MEHKFTFVDLFAGIGGFHAALSELGGKCIYAAEKDPDAQAVYSAAWGQEGTFHLAGDINDDVRPVDVHDIDELLRLAADGHRTVDKIDHDFDVLAAGFPCQAFSKSGKQQGVLDETRGTLFYNILRIVAECRPKVVFLENVRNLVGKRHRGSTFQTIIDVLRRLDYVVNPQPTIISPHRIHPEYGGGPQVRERVYILAVRSDLVRNESSPFTFTLPDWDAQKWKIDETPLWDGAPAVITDAWLEADASRSKYRELRGSDTADYSVAEEPWFSVYGDLVQQVVSRGRAERSGAWFPGHPIWFDAIPGDPDENAWFDQERKAADEHGQRWKHQFLEGSAEFGRQNQAVLNWSRPGGDSILGRIRALPTRSTRKFEWQAGATGNLEECLLQLRPSGVRVKKATYAPALVAINQTPTLGSEKRRITPYEAGRLQGFPDHVYEAMRRAKRRDGTPVPRGQFYKQFGNAVHVGAVIFALVQFIAHHVGDQDLEGPKLDGFRALRDTCREKLAWKLAADAREQSSKNADGHGSEATLFEVSRETLELRPSA